MITITGGKNDVIGAYLNITYDNNGNMTSITPLYDVNVAEIYRILERNFVFYTQDNKVGSFLIPLAPTTLTKMEVVVEFEDGTYLTRSISHEVHNFETPGTVIDFGTVSEEDGWKKVRKHQEEICVHHYALGQGKEQAQQVDLDLPSRLKWSSVNLGATSPEKYGDYYAWGATVPWIESYDQEGNVSSITLDDVPGFTHTGEYGSASAPTGVCQWNKDHNSYNGYNIPFLIDPQNDYDTNPARWSKYFPGLDNKTVLDPEDDAAVQQWGDGWRMPTDKECDELTKYCYWEWTPDYNGTGIRGVIVYKAKRDADRGIFHNGSIWKKTIDGHEYSNCSMPDGFVEYSINDDNYIFLPQPGACSKREIIMSGQDGGYWTSTLSLYNVNNSYSNNARLMYFTSNGVYSEQQGIGGGNRGRSFGTVIRPVHK